MLKRCIDTVRIALILQLDISFHADFQFVAFCLTRLQFNALGA
jgi:hypothetical protein